MRLGIRGIVMVVAAALVIPALAAAPTSGSHTNADFSSVSTAGSHGVLFAGGLNFTASDGTPIHYGLWLPDGAAAGTVPVIVTAGPYFGLMDKPADEPADRLGRFLIENFVPHGYAVAQVSVRGTGESGGCMEFMSHREALDLSEIVTHLATEPWASGDAAMIGKSYDGSTPWMVAQFGNPHLNTVVPIAGITSLPDLMFKNGTSEFRGPYMHSTVYYPFGFGAYPLDTAFSAINAPFAALFETDAFLTDPAGYITITDNPHRPEAQRARNAACPQALAGTALGPAAYATGSTADPASATYWEERDFRQGVLDNYTGSAFIVHGLLDWNVDPSQVLPFFGELDIKKKAWLGQWGHHYPDRPGETPHWTLRMDFADTLLNWFDSELKGQTVATGPVVEVQDLANGGWHSMSTYPPATTPQAFHVAPGGALDEAAPTQKTGYDVIATQAYTFSSWCGGFPGSVRLETAPLASDLHLAGFPTFHATVETATGGVLYAELCLKPPNSNSLWKISKAGMNLLYAHGGDDPQPFVPGQPFVAKMEFEPQDITVPKGWKLVLNVYHEGFLEPISHPMSTQTTILAGPGQQSVLTLPEA